MNLKALYIVAIVGHSIFHPLPTTLHSNAADNPGQSDGSETFFKDRQAHTAKDGGAISNVGRVEYKGSGVPFRLCIR